MIVAESLIFPAVRVMVQDSSARADGYIRMFDAALSSFGLFLSAPLWVLISAAIKIEDKGPVFYTQDRVGKDGRIFKVFKFRSMVVNAERNTGPVQACEHDPRVTKLGSVLRVTAMDELPQLLNIVKGNMSFVGPRALRPAEKEVKGNGLSIGLDMIPGYHARTTIKPGLTGLAQIYLSADTPRVKKFRYDVLYVRKRNFWINIRLIMLSFVITIKGKWESSTKKL